MNRRDFCRHLALLAAGAAAIPAQISESRQFTQRFTASGRLDPQTAFPSAP